MDRTVRAIGRSNVVGCLQDFQCDYTPARAALGPAEPSPGATMAGRRLRRVWEKWRAALTKLHAFILPPALSGGDQEETVDDDTKSKNR